MFFSRKQAKMVSYLSKLAALAALVPAILAAPAEVPHLKLRNPYERDVAKDSYIVVYADSVNATAAEAHVSSISSMISKRNANAKGVGQQWNLPTLKGYQVSADAATIAQIADSPEVRLFCGSQQLIIYHITPIDPFFIYQSLKSRDFFILTWSNIKGRLY